VETEHYPHKAVAVYLDEETAQQAAQALRDAELGDARIDVLGPDSIDVDRAIEPEPGGARNRIIEDMLAGSAAGAVAGGALIAGGASVLAPALFVSSPIVGPLIVLGYGAMIGGTGGAILGLRAGEHRLAGLVKDALAEGFAAVIVHTADADAESRAAAVIAGTMAEKTAHT
jgi:VIT1/CCC1 family predicted Fe2+/Mn2+ transporter